MIPSLGRAAPSAGPAPPSRLLTHVADVDGDRTRAAYPAAYDAFLDALWADDGDAAAALVSDGVIGANDVFAYGPAVPYQMVVPGIVYVGPEGQRLAGGGRLPVDLPRPPPPTPLGQAVAMGAVHVADALLHMGARPWPSSEALLNTGLATLPAVAVAPAVALHRPARSSDAVDMVLLLLDALAPSTPADPWDPNPLTVLRLAATAQSDGDPRRARQQVAQLLGPLLARYRPDAPAAAVQVPGARVTHRDALEGVPRAPDAYDSWRLERASMSEADALATDLDRASSENRGFTVPAASRNLSDLLGMFARAYESHGTYYDDGAGTYGRYQRDDDVDASDAHQKKKPTLPWVSVTSMAPAQIAALVTSRHAGRPVGVDTARQTAARLRLLYAANGCADYVGCASLLIEAIAHDNAQEVRRLMAMARGLGPGSVFDGHRLRTAGNPVVLARWQGDAGLLPASDVSPVADAGAGLAGDMFTTPLAVAAATGAADVITTLIGAGVRPWPTLETVLAPALAHPLALTIDVASVEGGASLAPARTLFDDRGADHIIERPYDSSAVVRLLTRAFPREGVLGPWDVNPLTTARAHAIHAAASASRRSRDRSARARAVARLLQILSALLDAGYSPHDPTAGPMVRAPYSPSRAVAPTELDAAVWTAAHTREGTLAHALATAAVGLYAARQAWIDDRERPATVDRRAGRRGTAGLAADSWVMVGDEASWQSASDDSDQDGMLDRFDDIDLADDGGDILGYQYAPLNQLRGAAGDDSAHLPTNPHQRAQASGSLVRLRAAADAD
ncbi:hypothetical protein pkur_cds_74 [Pandoravirus kuranda]|uniref:Uncharacterized protein n=1 Tax=Pandoravirus kuranda TaxID=3019033 RepID=A0AA95J1Y0_9VIRU|nr:hypothetical protein pkur_cds_74 [Pandoravirus kuranda]